MANILGFTLGSKFPNTEKYENENQNLINDFNKFHALEKSDTIIRFFELDTLIHSGDFEKKVLKLKKETFKDTEAYQKFRKYKEYKRSANVKRYNKLIKENKADEEDTLKATNEVQTYLKLKKYVESEEFATIKKESDAKEFKGSDAFKNFSEYKKLKRSSTVKRYNKLALKNRIAEIEELKNSTEIQTHNDLKNYIESDEYATIKKEMSDKHRFKKTKEYQLQEEHKALSKTEDVIWFLKTKNKNSFHELDKWDLTFEDDFNGTKLDESKWITGYYWGKALLNDTYVQANEKQFFKKENIELRDGCARIISRNERCKGKVWNPELGFVPQDFEYTSGLLSTGQSFRQKFGRFEAKIKFNHTYPAAHTFWLLAEQIAPQINILKTPEKSNKKIEVGHFWANDKELLQKTQNVKIPGSSDQFYIYTLEWSKNKLEWKINGVPVYTQTENVPQEAMYISLSSHFTSTPSSEKLPISMDVDWVRCYQLN
ncbi:glycosyl hydrolase family protein [Labilibacter sediminis]|nr:glycosyl hydrolase family protein [Labilibacter sediminis]